MLNTIFYKIFDLQGTGGHSVKILSHEPEHYSGSCFDGPEYSLFCCYHCYSTLILDISLFFLNLVAQLCILWSWDSGTQRLNSACTSHGKQSSKLESDQGSLQVRFIVNSLLL